MLFVIKKDKRKTKTNYSFCSWCIFGCGKKVYQTSKKTKYKGSFFYKCKCCDKLFLRNGKEMILYES